MVSTGLSKRQVLALIIVVIFIISIGTFQVNQSTRPKMEDDYRPTVLITGSNRGIGLEFARQYAELGWWVIATARRPKQAKDLFKLQKSFPAVVIEKMDVTSNDDIVALAKKYQGEPIDVLLNNAGILPGSSFDDPLNDETFQKVLAVNTLAPLKVSLAMLDSVANSRLKIIAVISSGLGSIDYAPSAMSGVHRDNNFYSISKAAVNMAMRRLKGYVSGHGIKVAILAPGAVRTDMLAQTKYDFSKANPVDVPVSGLIEVLGNLTDEQSGVFLRYDGQILYW